MNSIEIETRTKPTSLANAVKIAELLQNEGYVISVRKYRGHADSYFVLGRKLLSIGTNTKAS